MADYVIRQSNQRGAQGASGPAVALAANTIAGNNTSASASATGLTAAEVRDLIGAQSSTSVSKTSYHTPTTTAVLNGQTIDSGQTPTVTGVGIATTVSSSSGYIHDPTNTNTYIFVNSGSAVKRVEQLFRGTQGVIAICLAANANNMIHVEFPTGSTAAVTYGATEGGFPQYPDISRSIATIPNLNDGTTHKLAVEIDGDLVTVYVDDVCVGFSFDPIYSTLAGNWYYCQITAVTANCKIYGFSSYDTLPQSHSVVAGSVRSGSLQSQCLQVGQVSDATYEPTTSIHLWTNQERARLEGKTYSVLTMEALGAGSVAKTEYLNAIGVQLDVGVGASNGIIAYQGNNVINMPVNGYVGGTYMELLQFSTTGIVATSWPTSDPTGGKLWLKGGIVRHGTDSAATAAASIGLGTNDSPEFTGIGIGRAGFAGHIDLYDDVDDVTIEIDAIQNGIQVGGNLDLNGGLRVADGPGLFYGDTGAMRLGTGSRTVYAGALILTRDLTANSNAHGYDENSTFRPTSNGYAYNSFDARAQISGTANIDHYAAFQEDCNLSTSGTVARIYGLVSTPTIDEGVLTDRFGVYINDITITGSGVCTNNYGVYVAHMDNAGANWAVYTAGTTPSYFGGPVTIGTANISQLTNASGSIPLVSTIAAVAYSPGGIDASIEIGTRGTGGSLYVHTPSYGSSYDSGLGVHGIFTLGNVTSTVYLTAYGVNSGGGFRSDFVFRTTENGTVTTVGSWSSTVFEVTGAIKTDKSTTSGHTRFFIYDVDNGTLERVTVGAADSGGSGFKVLRIPN